MMRRSLSSLAIRLGRLFGCSQGSISIVFGLMLIPTALAIGAGIDFARALQLKTELQSAVDAASLAGASAYVSTTTSSSASTVATNYMNSAITNLPANMGVTYTVTPSTKILSGSTTGYMMTVSATTSEKPTLMALVTTGIPVSVTAEAENPIVTAKFDSGNFYSSAYDLNVAYWYVVPSDGSLPTTAELNLMWSNASLPCGATSGTLGSPVTVQLPASQKIGFVLKNTTGGKCGYGSNQYGGAQGSTHYFYSQEFPPSATAYPSVSSDRSLQILSAPSDGYITNPPVGSFSSPSSPTPYIIPAAASCSQLLGQTYLFAWNDMGGGTDDLDYNDMEYTFSCSAPGSVNTGVVLVQ
jgi:Flp pilus assembly protein TadG